MHPSSRLTLRALALTLILIATGAFGTVAGAQQAAVLEPKIYATIVMGGGSATLPAPPASIPSDWLGRLNAYRALAGLPPVTENAAWSAGAAEHARYVVKNDELTHTQNPGKPYASATGATAARNSNVLANGGVSTSDASALDGWMQAPFHALGMIDPRLTQSGYGSYREADGGFQMAAALDVIRGIDGSRAASTAYPVIWPANGQSMPFTTYAGGESPDPLTGCPGYQLPTGAPLYVQFGSGGGSPSITASSLTQGGQALAHCVYSETTYTNPDGSAQSLARSVLGSRDAVVIIPRLPLTPGATYAVSLTVNGVTRSWSFNVSLSASPSTLALDPAPAAETEAPEAAETPAAPAPEAAETPAALEQQLGEPPMPAE